MYARKRRLILRHCPSISPHKTGFDESSWNTVATKDRGEGATKTGVDAFDDIRNRERPLSEGGQPQRSMTRRANYHDHGN
jgi:hypothetical protein